MAGTLQRAVQLTRADDEVTVLERGVAWACHLTGASQGVALVVGSDGAPAVWHQTGSSGTDLPPWLTASEALQTVLGGRTAWWGRPADPVPSGARGVDCLGIPLAAEGRVLGALCLTDQEPGGDHAATVAAVADLTAGTIAALRARQATEVLLSGLNVTAARGGDDPVPATGPGPAGTSPVVQRLLAAARSLLGMQLTFLAHIEDGRQTFVAVDAAAPTGTAADAVLVVTEGLTIDAASGYCALMLREEVPSAVPSVLEHPLLGPMEVTNALGIGAYCGVPVRLPDGRLFGSLCGLDSASISTPTLAQVGALQTIAALLGHRLADEEQERSAIAAARQTCLEVSTSPRRLIVVQPIVDLAGGQVLGYEALSRFFDTRGTPLPPDSVFRQARALGLTVEVEQAAADQAIALQKSLPASAYLSVNLSPSSLLHAATVELLAGADLSRLVLEITEHEQVVDYAELIRTLTPLRARGLRLAVDDTGAGFAGLQHLARLAPDVIKLDVALVRGADTDPAQRAVARALAGFALEVGATLVAEGIETPAEARTMRALGARCGQGFLFGRPEPLMGGRLVPPARG